MNFLDDSEEVQSGVWFHIGYGVGIAIVVLVIFGLSVKLHVYRR